MCILSGCGGSGHSNPQQQWRDVAMAPFRWQVPAGWKASAGKGLNEARHGSDYIQVQRFPLVHPYTDALFRKVEPELAARIAQVAKAAGGTVSGHRDVKLAGIRSHAYDVQAGGRTYRYTFLLHGRQELLVICRADAAVCDELESSFQPMRA